MTSPRPLKILLVAVEPSGDALGAALYRELKKLTPEGTEFFGCGGLEMAKEGFESVFATDAFSVIGLSGFLKAIPEGIKKAKEIGQLAAERDADIGIYIDGWAFSWRAARYTKKFSPRTKTVKYATPQVWASRPGRVKTVKAHFDEVLNLLPFEPQIFEEAGVKAKFTGNPNFQKAYNQPIDEKSIRDKYGINSERVLCVLPGSRKGEVNTLSQPFNEIIDSFLATYNDLEVLLPVAPAVKDLVTDKFPARDRLKFIEADDRYAAFKLSTAALAASGTVSTELAIAQCPMVVAYKMDLLTYLWVKMIAITEYASILNIAAQRLVIPEFLQDDCEPEKIIPVLDKLLSKQSEHSAQLKAFKKLLDDLEIEKTPAAENAARAILEAI